MRVLMLGERIRGEQMPGDQPSGVDFADGLQLSPMLQVQTLPTPSGSGPGFFHSVYRSFRKAAQMFTADVYLASDLYVLPALAAAAAKRRGKLVFDSRELYAHLDSSANKPWVRVFWRAVEGRYIRKADAVMTVNDSISARLASMYQIEIPLVLHNVSDAVPIARSNRLREEFGIPSDQKIVLYQGGLRAGRGLPQLIRAVAEVDFAHLVIIGDGPFEDEARRLASSQGDRIRFLPFTLPDELLALTASADLGVVLIEPLTESLRLALPNKLFEYLVAGIPVLASPLPEIKRVMDTFDVGILASPDDHPQLVDALRTALTDETERARWRANATDALRSYSWEREKGLFQNTIHHLLTS